jgi:anti-anti-sigma factor
MEIVVLDGLPGGFRVRGDIDLESVADLEAAIQSRPDGVVVLDLRDVTFIDSMGLRLLIRVAARPDVSPSLVVKNPSRQVLHLLNIAVPGGVRGMEIAFDGAGPGTVHALTGAVEHALRLRRDLERNSRRSRRNLERAARLVESSRSAQRSAGVLLLDRAGPIASRGQGT